MGLFSRFLRRKEDPEPGCRPGLLQSGRIGDAKVIDVEEHEGTITVFYRYCVGGVEYESSQVLDREQQERESDYLPGAHVTIRYDPQRPANSLVV